MNCPGVLDLPLYCCYQSRDSLWNSEQTWSIAPTPQIANFHPNLIYQKILYTSSCLLPNYVKHASLQYQNSNQQTRASVQIVSTNSLRIPIFNATLSYLGSKIPRLEPLFYRQHVYIIRIGVRELLSRN